MPFPIRFLPENRTWRAEEATDLFLAAAGCDILVEQPCGSKTICGKCRVRIVEGELAAGAADRRLLGAGAVAEGWRLGCQLQIDRAATIEVPPLARTAAAKTFGDDTLVPPGFEPALRKVRVHVPEADDTRQVAAVERLAAALGMPHGLECSLYALRSLAAALEHGVDVWAVLNEGRLIAVEPGSAPAAAWGLAIDIGSTTLAAALVDLATGDVASTASQLNPQVRFGGDIISRIHYAQEHAGAAAELHAVLTRALGAVMRECLAAAHADVAHVYGVACVGNPTMLHTLLGVDITTLGQAPYVGVVQGAWRGSARELGLELPEYASAYVLPGIRSHVGADTVAAILACGMDRAEGLTLMVDLGTNSEVALGSRAGIVCTSTSAGPAFEGANIYMGMRGAPGAIDQVRVRPTGSIMVRTIAGEEPAGVCGSGLIDAAAELVRAGVVEPSGRMRPAAELAGSAPERLLGHLVELPETGRAVWLAGEDGRKVYLTAGDIRQLQLVKGSILAGMKTLLEIRRARDEDLAEVLIAGAFGNYIRKTSAQAIGLVPRVDPERIRFVGNAAGAGARLALVDRSARRRAEQIAASAEYVELGNRPDYQDAFVEAMAFPAPTAGESDDGAAR